MLLLRPKLLSLVNRWKRGIDLRGQAGRDIFIVFFSLLVVAFIYVGTHWALHKLRVVSSMAYLPPSQFLGLVFMLLQIMLLITATLAAVGTLFFAEDLELLLASPLSSFRFFVGKLLKVLVAASWMPFIFIFPFLAAFANFYGAAPAFYAVSLFSLIPFFVLPTALGIFLSVVIMIVIPLNRLREIVTTLLLAFGFGVWYSLIYARIAWSNLPSAQQILHVLSLLSAPQATWLPSRWVSLILEEYLRPTNSAWTVRLQLLCLSALASVSLAYLGVVCGYQGAYSRSRNRWRSVGWAPTYLASFTQPLMARLKPAFRAVLLKEVRLLSRDFGQVLQLLMLFGVALMYLYHLSIFSTVESFPEAIRPWWRNFLFTGNVTMGSFITTAICTRFVYPTISLEGRSLWIVQQSPVEIRQLIYYKFWCWLMPVSLASCLFFVAGAYTIGADWSILLLNAVISMVMCYGLVGLAIGIGAAFARFDWEHASQLSGGIGSLMYMITALTLIFLNILPVGVFLFTDPQAMAIRGVASLLYMVAYVVILIVLNGICTHVALKDGERLLVRQIQ